MTKSTNDRNYNGIASVSTVVIAAGIMVLIQINGSDIQETGETIETAKIQSDQMEQNAAVFRTTAGAADILDTDLLQVVLGTTAGAVCILDEDFSIDAQEAADENAEESEYANLAIAKVNNYVNVRSALNTDGEIIGKMYDGSVAQILSMAGENNEWFQVVSGNVEGYIKAEEFIYAESIEEERAEMAALQELQARTQASEEAVPERMAVSVPPQTNYANVSDLRSAVIDYAMQYLGNRYVHGGQSLATGTGCSGFTCYVYKEFGYSLSRTQQG